MGMLVQFQLQQAVQVVVLGPELVSKFTSVPREGRRSFKSTLMYQCVSLDVSYSLATERRAYVYKNIWVSIPTEVLI